MRKLIQRLMPSFRGAYDILYDAAYKLSHRNTRRPPAGGPAFRTDEDGKRVYIQQSDRH